MDIANGEKEIKIRINKEKSFLILKKWPPYFFTRWFF